MPTQKALRTQSVTVSLVREVLVDVDPLPVILFSRIIDLKTALSCLVSERAVLGSYFKSLSFNII